MFLKRLRQEAGKQNWFGVGVDLVILIVGVFLGIQVNNWNQARLDRQKGHDYRQRLIEDIDANNHSFVRRRIYYSTVRSFATAALAALDRPLESDPAAFLVAAYQASQIIPTKLRRATYDEILATGNLENLGDAKTRELIMNFYNGVDTVQVTFSNVPPYREHIRSVMPTAAQDAVRTQCPESVSFDEDGNTTSTLPAQCKIKIDQADAVRDARIVRSIPTLRDDLNRQIADLDGKLFLVDAAQKRGNQVRKKLVAANQ